MAISFDGVGGGRGFDGFDPGWDRQAVGWFLAALVTKTTGIQARGGIVGGSSPLAYTRTTGMSGQLSPGVVLVPTTQATYGVMPAGLQSASVFLHPNSDPTNPRSDLIIAKVKDTGDPLTTAITFELLAGTPGPTAPDPAMPVDTVNGGSIALWRVPIAAGATSPGIPVDLRTYTMAVGGTVRKDGALATPSLVSSYPPDTVIYDGAVNRFAVRNPSTGLVDVDNRPQVRFLDLSRSSVPGTGSETPSSGTYGLGPPAGYKVVWTYNSAESTTPNPTTTTRDSGTTLVLSAGGWYQIDGTVQTHAATTAVGRCEVIYSDNAGVNWHTVSENWYPTGVYPVLSVSTGLLYYPAGSWIQLWVLRPTGTTGGLDGRIALTLLRT